MHAAKEWYCTVHTSFILRKRRLVASTVTDLESSKMWLVAVSFESYSRSDKRLLGFEGACF